MASVSPLLRTALGFVLLGVFAAMVMAWRWFVGRLRERRPVLPTPATAPRPAAWGGLTVGFVVLTWLTLNVVLSAGYLQWRRAVSPPKAVAAAGSVAPPSSRKPPLLSFTEQMAIVSALNVLILVIVPAALRFANGVTWDEMGLGPAGLARHARTGAVAFLLVTPVVLAINLVAALVFEPRKHPVEQLLRGVGLGPGLLLAAVSAVVFAPLAEELIFRGVLQRWLQQVFKEGPPAAPEAGPGRDQGGDGRDGPPIAPARPIRWLPRLPVALRSMAPDLNVTGSVVWTSLAFAAVHLPQMPAPFAIFVLSVVLGKLAEQTGSLVPSVVLHALFNGFNLLILIYALLAPPS